MLRIDKVRRDAHILSCVVDNACKNGDLVQVGSLRADGESFDCSTIIGSGTAMIGVVAEVELDYDEDWLLPTDWDVDAGDLVRVYLLEKGDILTVASSQIDGAHAVDDVLGVDTISNKLKGAVTGTDLQVTVIEKPTLAGVACTSFMVL